MVKHKLNKLYTILAQDKETGKYYGITSIHDLNEDKSIVFSFDTKGNMTIEGTNPNSPNQKVWFYMRNRAQFCSLILGDRYVVKPYRINSKSCPVKFNLKKFRKSLAMKSLASWTYVHMRYADFKVKEEKSRNGLEN